MSLELIDHRTKIAPTTDALLDALAKSRGITKAEVSRVILDQYAQVCIHESSVVCEVLSRNPSVRAVGGLR